jgi:hypothetical protein
MTLTNQDAFMWSRQSNGAVKPTGQELYYGNMTMAWTTICSLLMTMPVGPGAPDKNV